VVYEPVPYTEEEKSKAEVYVCLSRIVPTSHFQDMLIFGTDDQRCIPRQKKHMKKSRKTWVFVELDLETPPERGEELPVYELATMPGCFYHGEWKKGRPHGLGRLYGINGIFYQGGFEGGVATCKMGLFIYPDGSYY